MGALVTYKASLGGFKVDSTFHSPEIDQLSTKKSWGLKVNFFS